MPINHPNEIHEQFLKAVNARDVDALVGLYDTSGIAVQLDGGECTGEAAMREWLTGFVQSVQSIDGTTRKVFVSGDIAMTSAEWTATLVAPDGTVQQQSGVTAELSRRQPDGTWLMVIDDPTFA